MIQDPYVVVSVASSGGSMSYTVALPCTKAAAETAHEDIAAAADLSADSTVGVQYTNKEGYGQQLLTSWSSLTVGKLRTMLNDSRESGTVMVQAY